MPDKQNWPGKNNVKLSG